ncbi:tetratricopeptide repeat protein [Crocosphaera sp. Alani8]|uniref:tetratricopeptide repeat protein n=1 Tax=Crocosphaera sp. Alani8 TaxID=3038952 RepID=UPI00313BAE98
MLENNSLSILKVSSFLANNEDNLAELSTFIDFSEGLTIGFIEVNSNQENEWIIDSLMSNYRMQNIQFMVLNIDDSQVRFLLDEILNYLSKNPPLEDKKQVIIIKGLENSIGLNDYPPVLQNLNFVRNSFTYDVPYPILFCLPHETITRFARFAPDFWAWKSGIFKFDSIPEEKNIDHKFLSVDRVIERDKVSETKKRVDLLTRLFREYSAKENIPMMVTALQQLGVAHYRREELQEAEESLLEALNLSVQRESLEPTKIVILEMLGDVYRKGKKYQEAETIYQQALNFYSEQRYRQNWARIHNSLGNVYLNKNQGSKADNLEAAIAAYERSLEVYTRDAFPQDWAMTQNNLGIAYRNRLREERGDNLEQAIAAYQRSLEVYTRDAFPQDWAMTQNNLGIAYRNRLREERGDNLEQAIAAYQRSLEVYTHDAFPQDWAQTQNNLGAAYYSRIRGERADNLERAIAYYESSLEVCTSDAFPQDWAQTQNNLGVAYYSRIRGERADNLEEAIFCYRQALKILTFKSFPLDWAQTQSNLANAYIKRILGEKIDNLNQAITCYQNALKVYPSDYFPDYYAQIQYNLANSLRERFPLLKNRKDIEQAIIAYEQAKHIFEKTDDQDLIFDSYYQLGQAFFEGGYYTQAIEHLQSCHQTYLKKRDIPHLAPILFELARLYHRIGRLEQGRLYFKDSLRLFHRLGDKENAYSVTVALGNLEIQSGKIEQAYNHLKEAQNYYENHPYSKRIDEINQLLETLQSS